MSKTRTSERDFLLDAISKSQDILTDYLIPGSTFSADETINRILYILDDSDFVKTMNAMREA